MNLAINPAAGPNPVVRCELVSSPWILDFVSCLDPSEALWSGQSLRDQIAEATTQARQVRSDGCHNRQIDHTEAGEITPHTAHRTSSVNTGVTAGLSISVRRHFGELRVRCSASVASDTWVYIPLSSVTPTDKSERSSSSKPESAGAG
jgi:hypothetical protein